MGPATSWARYRRSWTSFRPWKWKRVRDPRGVSSCSVTDKKGDFATTKALCISIFYCSLGIMSWQTRKRDGEKGNCVRSASLSGSSVGLRLGILDTRWPWIFQSSVGILRMCSCVPVLSGCCGFVNVLLDYCGFVKVLLDWCEFVRVLLGGCEFVKVLSVWCEFWILLWVRLGYCEFVKVRLGCCGFC